MKQTITFSDFTQAFHTYYRYHQFGYDGLKVLFDYLEKYEESTGEEMELDVVTLCCDYCRGHWVDIAANYKIDLTDFEEDDEDGKMGAVRDYLQDNTVVCGETDDGFVYLCF